MSTEAQVSPKAREVVFKLLCDEEFAQAFTSNPEEAIAPYDLNDEEEAALAELDMTQLEKSQIEVARALDENSIRVGALYLTSV